jgi:hypothetical protein
LPLSLPCHQRGSGLSGLCPGGHLRRTSERGLQPLSWSIRLPSRSSGPSLLAPPGWPFAPPGSLWVPQAWPSSRLSTLVPW